MSVKRSKVQTFGQCCYFSCYFCSKGQNFTRQLRCLSKTRSKTMNLSQDQHSINDLTGFPGIPCCPCGRNIFYYSNYPEKDKSPPYTHSTSWTTTLLELLTGVEWHSPQPHLDLENPERTEEKLLSHLQVNLYERVKPLWPLDVSVSQGMTSPWTGVY